MKHRPPPAPSAIARLVAKHGGPTRVAAMLDGFAYQEVAGWVSRGWAPPIHALVLEPLLPRGVTLRDLLRDRDNAKAG